MTFFRKKTAFISVPPQRPTFVVTKKGVIARVTSFVVDVNKVSSKTILVTDEGDVIEKDSLCEIFTSPVSPERYRYILGLGASHEWNYRPAYFNQRCEEFGIEIRDAKKNNEEEA